MFGTRNRTVITSGVSSNGLYSYRLSDPVKMTSSWTGTVRHIALINKSGVIAAQFGKEIALARLDANNDFKPLSRYTIGDFKYIGGMALSNSGWLYVGNNERFITFKTSVAQ